MKPGQQVRVPFGAGTQPATVLYTRSDGRVVVNVNVTGTHGLPASYAPEEIEATA